MLRVAAVITRMRTAVFTVCALASLAVAARSSDLDRDGVANETDNCPEAANPAQLDGDGDGVGNACDTCPAVANGATQGADADGDGAGDLCDRCPETAADVPADDERLVAAVDGEGCSVGDRCPCAGPSGLGMSWRSASQYRACVRREGRVLVRRTTITRETLAAMLRLARESRCGVRRRSAADRDGDGVPADGDESGAVGDAPCSGGRIAACDDNCPGVFNRRQRDLDGDGRGDACDPDVDGDGVPDRFDRCPRVADPTQADTDGDRVGDACDRCPETPDAGDVDARGCGEGDKPASGAGAGGLVGAPAARR